ncbi:conserved Plasmodium protein, unknown function [Plasmodium gallinaceum]|uniref:Peptidase S9 prolyl oligopeptidase catalytic domain-containing protein n=1 Tax=Plasmodium gallinaceum TaxID=5849 RepID=A0A1J1GZP1_PLAGA|nr:conserved Plasmodium protein, unknown function [Plasmodium gallinaceum]CRG98086.1 conserved Plasmodium protein, unknown function [Plasmodium gallinaceum]
MKIYNYIFGSIVDSYHHIEKIKNIFEYSRINKYFKEINILNKYLNNYKLGIEENRNKIKKDVHLILRNNYLRFEKNIEDELILMNRYIYFEVKSEDYVMICRKKVKRKHINNFDFYQNKSINELKNEKIISNLVSEIIAIFPINFNIKFFKIHRNNFFSFIIERNDNHLNYCYIFKNSVPIKDSNIDNIDSNYILKNICSENEVINNLKKKKRKDEKNELQKKRFLKKENIYNNRNNGIIEKNNIDECYDKYNYNCNGNGNNLYKIKFSMISKCIYLKDGIQNMEFIPLKNKIDFLSTELNNKYRCDKCYLNCSINDKKLIFEEKQKEYFLNLYKSKDKKKIFLLSGSHLHNKLFFLHINYKKSNNYQINFIQFKCSFLRGKCFMENFYHYIIFIYQNGSNIDIYFMNDNNLNYILEKKKKKKDVLYSHKYIVFLRREIMQIDNFLKKIITLENYTLQDFDFTKYGLILYLYKYFLKPYICVLYLFRKHVYLINNNINNGNNYNTKTVKSKILKKKNNEKENRLIAKLKMFILPIKKGSIICGINNIFENPFINFYISNTFINNINLVINLRKCLIALPKNIYKDKEFFFKNKNILYDNELEEIFKKNKEFDIIDVFINSRDNKKIPITLIYKKINNNNIYSMDKVYKNFHQYVIEESNEKGYKNNITTNYYSIFKSHLPFFANSSKAIINVYPFYNEINICNYTDEYYFYLLNNFVIIYLHLRGSGGIQMKKDKNISRTYEKIKMIHDLIDCINFIKYKNISDTQNISLYLYSNSGLFGGYILNHLKKFVQNIIFINPFLDFFNNLTNFNNPYVKSEMLVFGYMDGNSLLLRNNTIEIYQKKKKKKKKSCCVLMGKNTNSFPFLRMYKKCVFIKGKHKNFKKHINSYKKIKFKNFINNIKNNLFFLYSFCPYFNITPNYSEVFTNEKKHKNELIFINERNNIPLKNRTILFLNKYDVICPNYNSIKYFLKYLNYKKIDIKNYYFVKTDLTLINKKMNFLNYHNSHNHKGDFYISYSKRGGHSGFNSYLSFLNQTIDKIYFHIFKN